MIVCHLTSVHPQEDIRIFRKECVSLAKEGFEVYLVSKGKRYDKLGVKLYGIGDETCNKINRIFSFSKKVYEKALSLNADIYHIHDPELLPYALKLKNKGKIVIYDSHEYTPGQIRDKKWIPKYLRNIISSLYKAFEIFVIKRLDAVIVAVPYVEKKFRGKTKQVIVINNYPILDDIQFQNNSFQTRDSIVCYAGGISIDRGEQIMIDSMKRIDGKLIIAGDHDVEKKNNVEYIGRIDRDGINELYGKSVVGLCLLRPIENYLHSQPIKMYEYMAAGLPFICSNFPGWIKIVDESNAGICVDPNNIEEISKAISKLLSNRELAAKMGENGRIFVTNNATWDNEKEKLIKLYKSFSIR